MATVRLDLEFLLKAARKLGLNVDAQAQRVRECSKSGGGRGILFDEYLGWLVEWEQQSGDSEVGLHMGERLELSDFGSFGHMLLYASSIEEFMAFIVQYEPLISLENSPRYLPGAQTSRLEYRVEGAPGTLAKHDIELTFAVYTAALRQYIGDDWNPVSVGFEYSRPDNTDDYRGHFGENLSFDQPVSHIELQNDILGIRIRNIDPDLQQVVRQYVDDLLTQSPKKRDSVYEQVRAIVIASIGKEAVTQDTVAQRLFMSRASLQRSLAAEGCSFRKVREEVIYHLARQALTNTPSSVSQIAQMLGYSESSAFNHAFLRLSGGMTPLQYRKKVAPPRVMPPP